MIGAKGSFGDGKKNKAGKILVEEVAGIRQPEVLHSVNPVTVKSA